MTHFEAKVPVDIPYMRSLLLLNKDFLQSIYNAQRKPLICSIIDKASNEEILLLLQIFYLEANGAIPLYAKHIKSLKAHKKISLFKTYFNHEGNYDILLLEEMCFKREFLKKFAPVLKVLMSPMFESDTK